MNRSDLLYVLEKVKAACPDKYGTFMTLEDSDDHAACLQLEADGLIRKYSEDDGKFLWQPMD